MILNETSIKWQSDKCLSILQKNSFVLINEKINDETVITEFKPVKELIKDVIVPIVDRSFIYDKIIVRTEEFSFSSHYSKWLKFDKDGRSLCNDRPNTPRCDFLYCILKKYMNNNIKILEIGPGVAFIPAYIIQDKLNCLYTGIDPQKEVHNKNIELYGKYNNINFKNKKLTIDDLDNNYDIILHCHPLIDRNLFNIYTNIAQKIKPKYFVIQTHGTINNSPNQVNKIYMTAIDIFIKAGYEKEFQIYDLNINKIYYNNNWWSPTNQTIIIMKYDK